MCYPNSGHSPGGCQAFMSSNMLLAALILVSWSPVLSSPIQNETYTHVQYSNLYCQFLNVESPNVVRISCDFSKTAARLGDAVYLTNPSEKSTSSGTGILHLEINNCSNLWISSEFQTTWRNTFAQMHLRINDVDDVIQEEIIGVNIIDSDLISFAMKNSNMAVIHPHLISSTAALMIEIVNCNIGYMAESSFQNVQNLWQMRVYKTTINKIDSNAMPSFLSISPPPASINVDWVPFIFNDTHIQEVQSEAIRFYVSGKDEYLNFVHCRFSNIQPRGLQVTGKGHVLFADSVFVRIQDDSVILSLKADEKKAPNLSGLSYPTLTLMGLKLYSVDVANFLNHLQVHEGKLYLMRIAFAFPGALQSIIDHSERWINQTTYIERITATCSCLELEQFVHKSDDTNKNTHDAAVTSHPDLPVDYEDLKSMSEGEANVLLSPGQQMHKELNCYSENSEPLDPRVYQSTYCSQPTVSVDQIEPEMATEEPEVLGAQLAYFHEHWLVHTLGIASGSVILIVATMAAISYYRKRRSFNLEKQRIGLHNQNKNQVGVLSEEPICGEEGEEGEDEC